MITPETKISLSITTEELSEIEQELFAAGFITPDERWERIRKTQHFRSIAPDPVTVSALSLVVVQSMLPKILECIKTWVQRNESRAIKVKLGEVEIELAGNVSPSLAAQHIQQALQAFSSQQKSKTVLVSPAGKTKTAHVTLTADIVLFRRQMRQIEILLIKRGRPPYVGMYALPGGKVGEQESAEQAAHRELLEETGIDQASFQQIGTFSAPDRDPRGRFVSVAFLALLESEQEPHAGDDADDACWFPIVALPPLAFDHQLIISQALTAGLGGGKRA